MYHKDFFDLDSLKEGFDVELKTALGRDKKGAVPESFWETYSAMANTSGGIIILGAQEKDESVVYHNLPKYGQMIQDIWNNLNNPKKVSVNILQNRNIKPKTYEGKNIIVVTVPQASRKQRPVYIGTNPLEGTYQRQNEGDYRCQPELVKQMLGEQANDTRDAVILENFTIDDIDKESYRIYRQQFSNLKPNHPFNECDEKEFLRQIGGWKRNRQNGKEGLTLAGLLMFGKFRSILDAVPNYIVDYQERENTDTRWVDRITLDGSWSGCLYDFYRTVMKKLSADLKVPFKLNGDERIEDTPVHEALREALVNTIIHADYSGNCSLLVVKRPDLFGFRNPGLMRIPKPEAIRGGISDCRNRNLQKMFQFIGLGEQAGSGFPKIYQNWQMQHWREPMLEERHGSNQTVFILKMTSLLPEEVLGALKSEFGESFRDLVNVERLAMVTAYSEGCVNHSRLKELSREHPHDITISLHNLVKQGLLASEGSGRNTFYYIPGRHPMGDEIFGGEICPKYSSEHLDNSSEHLDNSSEHLDNSSEHLDNSSEHLDNSSEHLATLRDIAEPVKSVKKASKALMESTIMELCSGRHLTIEELSSLLNRNKDTLRTHYIIPLLHKGKLEQKYKNVTTHPNQKYRAVDEKERE
ncbi:RNA-binding domain-containing protein [Methanoplanus limicola]|nr:RNA-binding domain-containing protein [Methanoplanus limicola]